MASSSTHLCYTEVLGQQKAAELVSRNLSSGRIPHGYIFKGPDGVGKQLFARGVAAAVNCRGDRTAEACGECTSCRKFLSGNQPDFVVIRPEQGTVKIAQVRELIRLLEYPPYESKFRVVLLEDVHTMRQEAANSLLKTLEEPPPGNMLILTVESSQEILTTLSSRCQVIPFYSLNDEQTMEVVISEQPDMDREAARLLACLSEGSPGRALLLGRIGVTEVFRRVTDVVTDPGVDGARDVHLLLKAAEEMAALKENLPVMLGLLRIWLGSLLKAGYDYQEKSGLKDLGLETGGKAKNWSCEQLFSKLEAVTEAESQLKRNCNRTLVCEVLLFQLHSG